MVRILTPAMSLYVGKKDTWECKFPPGVWEESSHLMSGVHPGQDIQISASLPGLPFCPVGRNGHVQAVINLTPIRLKVGCVTSWSPLFLSLVSIITLRTINSNLDIWFGALWVRNLAVPDKGDVSSSGEVAQAWECVPVPGFAFCAMPSLSSWFRSRYCVEKLLLCESNWDSLGRA